MTFEHVSVQRAITFIKEMLSNGEFKDGDRLPTARSLAISARIATRFITRALQLLQEQGVITVVRGRGIFVGNRKPDLKQPAILKWEKIRMLIEQDIIQGNLRLEKQITSLRELQQRFNASYFICRKAVEELVHKKILVPQPRGYKVLLSRDSKSYSSILLLGLDDGSGKISIMDSRFREFIYSLEMEQRRVNMRLDRAAIARCPELDHEMCVKEKKDNTHIGYIIWSNGISNDYINQILRLLSHTKKPCAVVDENGNFLLDRKLTGQKNILVFTIAGRKAGEQVGIHMLGFGHQKIAYISLFHEFVWSKNRLWGLIDAYKNAGFSDSVIPMVIEKVEEKVKLTLSTIKKIEKYYILEDLPFNRGLTWYDMFGAGTLGRAELKRYEVWKEALIPICRSIAAKIKSMNERISGCVFCNDMTAIIGLNILRGMKLDISRDYSLVSFDDTEFAYQNDISSYNFAFSQVAQKTLAFLLNPRHEQFGNQVYLECEGILMVRGSSKRA